MKFLTGFFPLEYTDESPYCSHVYITIRKKDGLRVVFACVWGNVKSFGAELWMEWFHRHALAPCESGNAEKCVDRVMGSFAGLKNGTQNDLPGKLRDFAVFFGMGEECFYAWKGSVDIRLINLCFDKVHIKSLTVSSDELMYTRVRLEPDVGILIGSRSFFAQLHEQLLKECLCIGDMKGRTQVERHLHEAALAAQRMGAESVAAAIVVARDVQSGEFTEVLNANGYRSPVPIGRGEFGSVYCVKDVETGRSIACKMAEGLTERNVLRREAALLKEIGHPLFARYVGCADGEYGVLLFMEYVRGRNLGNILRKGPLSQRRAVLIAKHLAEGLSYLHGMPEPVIYRDLKPDNIQIGLTGKVKLLDLGCACKLSEADASRAGSRGYAAPEQLNPNGGACGFYSDVYALGRVMLEMMGGSRVSEDVLDFIMRCTDETPSKRPQDMGQVLDELKKF